MKKEQWGTGLLCQYRILSSKLVCRDKELLDDFINNILEEKDKAHKKFLLEYTKDIRRVLIDQLNRKD